MNKNTAETFKMGRFTAWCLVLMTYLLLVPAAVLAQSEGSEACAMCHSSHYEDWVSSGHSVILVPGANASNRALPLPQGHTWGDISYVVGGNKTRAVYLDDQGYMLDEQYNLKTGEWTQLHGGGMVPYDCAACHSTGYSESGNQDGLPGFTGTFELPGVQCERCHQGSHPAPAPVDAAFCGECHNHSMNAEVLAMDGFILSEGQYNEFMAGPHAGSSQGCVACHDPHKKGEFSITTDCSTCHPAQAASYDGTLMDSVGVDCNDCHMPPATLSGQALGPFTGDMKTHIFNINTDADASMFTPDGSAVALVDGEAAVTLDFVCQRCHAGTSLETLEKFSVEFHSDGDRLQHVGLNPGLSGTWYNADRAGEGFLIEFAYFGPTPYFFGSFYTYDSVGNMVWLTFQPATTVPETGTSIEVIAYIIEGGRFGEGNPGVTPDRFGTATFTFNTCTSGNISIMPDQAYLDLGFTNFSYDIVRLMEAGIACPTFDNTSGVVAAAE